MLRRAGVVGYSPYYCGYQPECHCLKWHPLKDVLKDVKCRRGSLDCWYSHALPLQKQEASYDNTQTGSDGNIIQHMHHFQFNLQSSILFRYSYNRMILKYLLKMSRGYQGQDRS
jgi:hypothetical protein